MTSEQEQRILDNVGVTEVKPAPGSYPIEIRLKSNSVGRGFSMWDAAEQATEGIDRIEATVKIVGKGKGETASDAIRSALYEVCESTRWGK